MDNSESDQTENESDKSNRSDNRNDKKRYISKNGSSSKQKKRRRLNSLSSNYSNGNEKETSRDNLIGSEEEEDGEIQDEDYDSEEEEELEICPRKKRKTKDRYGGFVIDEAEVDDDGDEDEEYEDGAQELGIVENEADEVGPTAQEIEDRQRGRILWADQEDEDIEDYFRRKYANSELSGKEYFGTGNGMSEEIEQQTLLPSVKDPNVWLVKCRSGYEQETALILMRKFLIHEKADKTFKVKSVITSKAVKGYIYVEAYKQPHVKQIIENIGNLKMGIWQQKIVPIDEMTSILKVVKDTPTLKPKQWVRPKRGTYKNDIAQVDFVDQVQNKVHLKLIPRIDYKKKRGAMKESENEEEAEEEENGQENTSRKSQKRKKSMKKKNRPPQKLFDYEAIRNLGGEINPDGDFLVFEGNRYSAKGFLYKTYKCDALITDDVKPTLTELEIFDDSIENMHVGVPKEFTATNAYKTFRYGDKVEVCVGELANLQGTVVSVTGPNVIVNPNHSALTEPLEFRACELKKYFEMGDHVKVIAGEFKGDTGLVLRIIDNRVIVFSDLSLHEMDILSQDVQLCDDVSAGVDSLGQFQLGDLVTIDPQNVGVIVLLKIDKFIVLTMHGRLMELPPQTLSKRKNERACALDAHENSIVPKDVVKVIDGPHAGRTGVIKYLYRGTAFIKAEKHTENSGIIACKTRHLELKGGGRKTIPESGDDMIDGFMSPMAMLPNDSSTRKMYSSDRGRGNRRDRGLIGATVKIIRGPYKGRSGFCKDASDATVHIELVSSDQTIIVSKHNIECVEKPVDGSRMHARTSDANDISMYRPIGSKTPMYDSGSRTPQYGLATPLHDGSRTPNQNSAWDPTILNTPARSNDDYDEDKSPAISNDYDPGILQYSLRTPDIRDLSNQSINTRTTYEADHVARLARATGEARAARLDILNENRSQTSDHSSVSHTFGPRVGKSSDWNNRRRNNDSLRSPSYTPVRSLSPRNDSRTLGNNVLRSKTNNVETWDDDDDNDNNDRLSQPYVSSVPFASPKINQDKNTYKKPRIVSVLTVNNPETWDDDDDDQSSQPVSTPFSSKAVNSPQTSYSTPTDDTNNLNNNAELPKRFPPFNSKAVNSPSSYRSPTASGYNSNNWDNDVKPRRFSPFNNRSRGSFRGAPGFLNSNNRNWNDRRDRRPHPYSPYNNRDRNLPPNPRYSSTPKVNAKKESWDDDDEDETPSTSSGFINQAEKTSQSPPNFPSSNFRRNSRDSWKNERNQSSEFTPKPSFGSQVQKYQTSPKLHIRSDENWDDDDDNSGNTPTNNAIPPPSNNYKNMNNQNNNNTIFHKDENNKKWENPNPHKRQQSVNDSSINNSYSNTFNKPRFNEPYAFKKQPNFNNSSVSDPRSFKKQSTNNPNSSDEYNWLEPNLEVIIKDTYDDWDLEGQAVVVNHKAGDKCNITVLSNNKTLDIECKELEPSRPQTGERIKVISGKFCNQIGTLQSIDKGNGVVEVDSEESKVIPLKSLCKMKN